MHAAHQQASNWCGDLGLYDITWPWKIAHLCSMTNATKYAAVLETLFPNARSLFGEKSWIFYIDNAHCHRPKFVKRWMQSHRVIGYLRYTGQPRLQISTLSKIYATETMSSLIKKTH